MGGTAPANQLRLSFTGSEDGEAEKETCRAAKPLWRTTNRNSGPRGLNSLNGPMRPRTYGGVAGGVGPPPPQSALPGLPYFESAPFFSNNCFPSFSTNRFFLLSPN